MGWLFIANFLGGIVSAVGIFRRKLWLGWGLGVLVVAGSILGYVLSRTVGMPGMEIEGWFDPIGILAMAAEGLFLIVFAIARPWMDGFMTFRSSLKSPQAAIPGMMLSVILVSVLSYQMGLKNGNNSQHPLPDTSISVQALEENYGIKMELIAITAAGGLVDVRYRVIDPAKAAGLMTEDGIMPMLHIADGDNDVVLMPDSHMRTQKLVAGRMYFMLIPNAKNVVKRGTSVIVAFNDIALEPIAAK
jgi:hypothetical protein